MAEGVGFEIPVSVRERYYKTYFSLGGIEEQCVLQHSNRVCVVCLSPTHPLVKNSNVTVASIDFLVDGKRKKKVTTNSILCVVHCKSGVTYSLRRYPFGDE
jgi:hypothetical protein